MMEAQEFVKGKQKVDLIAKQDLSKVVLISELSLF